MRVVFLILMAVLSASLWAGVRHQDRKTSIALLAVVNNFDTEFASQDGVATPVSYSVNTPTLGGVEVTYSGLTLAYLSSGGIDESEVEAKGKTSYEDARGSLHLGADKQWVVSGHYNRYKGFYVENTEELTPGATVKIQRPDIEMFNSGASLMYIFSAQNYSAAAAYAQSDIQTESGGSFLAMTSFESNYIKGEAELIPSVVRADYGEQQNLKEARFVTGSVLAGYAHTFVWRGFFFNGTILLGTGSQRQSYTYDDLHQTKQSQAFKQVISGALGYNGEQFFAGGAISFNRSDYDVGSVKINPNLNSAKTYIGFRF